MANVNELRDLRGKAVADARSLKDTADKENRGLTAEEKVRWDAYMADERRLKLQIEDEIRLQDIEREVAAEGLRKNGNNEEHRQNPGNPAEEQRKASFRKLIMDGHSALTPEELRGLTAGTDVKGGFTLTPQEFIAQLIANVKDQVFMRKLATVIPLNGSSSCGVPTLDTDVGDADWTPEIKTVTEDDNLAFGKRELKPHALSKLVKVSEPLLRNSALNPEAIVNDRMSYKFGVSMEKAYLLGSGAQQPLGVFVASNDGVPTSRDVSYGNTATEIKADGLIKSKYSLKAAYMTKAQWLFHRDAIAQLAMLKDGNGRYIFELSDNPNVPDMLLGRPLIMSEFAPNTFTANSYVGMFADFSHYWIADSLQLQFRRLNELFSLSNQVGFIGRMETDGMPVLAEAFVRIKLGA